MTEMPFIRSQLEYVTFPRFPTLSLTIRLDPAHDLQAMDRYFDQYHMRITLVHPHKGFSIWPDP